ncbi:protein NRT1/ PTR FAMILY 4.6 isoform X1 [Gossypium hirsutum]|uniref:Protein NRT1/ PTR FAMILY 4.6 isoform X1 n=2 Tax=Gossypium TaxID=3633 RepID=A0A1U8MS13_GOSHI|nr:protein NRT1/ PTR FAMILY 4.6-like isoform X1 [Gossypium hirsutum]XP_016729611.1 protein NRT1/ PTR FAMILY 4.6-like isoform X1 [Gossypium hirsutum]XP_040950053.1 protein NRT1/ PTR FAMILY 4.6-like isoform X1 [Gossypium hirsutum]XP_040950054.1 protein NRT1/ PTR FAMILY 4.6-like isoform X1 [Gossypium hirsutum]XP_040950055.1 protein NRT1/ PTR FAMILY 4.6-like isoform X1 [Gossypium hirsutum]
MTWPSKKQNVGDKGYTFCLCHGMAGEYGIYLKCHKPGNLLLCLHELQPNQISNHPYKFHGSLFLVALFGGFISDTYLSRFKTCVLFGSIELLGYAALTAQVHFHRLRPPSCQGLAISQTTQCQAADSGQAAILFTGLYHVAFGASGVKAALLSLGADQFDERDPKRSSFFNWFLLSFAVGAIIGVTFIVWISTNQGNGRWMHAR